MRILWASHLIPYPPKSGVHLRSYHLLRAVAQRHEVDLVAFVQEPWLRVFYASRAEALRDCREHLGQFCRSVRFLEIESVARRGGRWRTALAGLLLPRCYTVRWLDGAHARGVFAAAGREHYALAHFDTVGLAPYRGYFPGVPATLGHHNIESHMLLRRAANEPQLLRRWYFLQEGRRVRAYERRTAARFAAHVTCSELDAQRLRELAAQARVCVIPNGVDTEYFRPLPRAAAAARRSIVFVGSLNWYPNVSAVEFLLREIWPPLQRAVPDLTLDLVGSAPPPAIRELAATLPNVTVHGYVDDVRPFLAAALLYVCPIRDGGGTKLKLLDAFAMEKCVVAHPIACEGIEILPGKHVELAESAAAFVAVIERLLADPERRAQLGRAARELAVARYGFAGIGRQLCEVFETIGAQRDRASSNETAST
jgi:glycosyltransferase involved in cell wall biosynthesis